MAGTSSGVKKVLKYFFFGAIFIFIFLEDAINSFKDAPYLFEQTTAEIADGAYLQEDIYAALDTFMDEETSRTKYGIKISSWISPYTYIVPVLTNDADQLYMAIEVPPNAESVMSSICEDTYGHLISKLRDLHSGTNSYHVKGKVRDMTEEEIQSMVEWFQTTGYLGTTNENIIRSHIHPVMLEKYNGTSARIAVSIGIVFILIGFSSITLTPSRSRQRRKNTNYKPPKDTYSQSNTFQPYQPFQHNNTKPANDMYLSRDIQEYDSMYVPPSERQPSITAPTENVMLPRREFPPNTMQQQNSVYQPFNQQPQKGQVQSKIMQMHAAMYQTGNTRQSGGQNLTSNIQQQSNAFPPRNSKPQSNAFPPRNSQPQNNIYQTDNVQTKKSFSDTYTSDSSEEQYSNPYPSPNPSFYDSSSYDT